MNAYQGGPLFFAIIMPPRENILMISNANTKSQMSMFIWSKFGKKGRATNERTAI
jgi:hypothetical protein